MSSTRPELRKLIAPKNFEVAANSSSGVSGCEPDKNQRNRFLPRHSPARGGPVMMLGREGALMGRGRCIVTRLPLRRPVRCQNRMRSRVLIRPRLSRCSVAPGPALGSTPGPEGEAGACILRNNGSTARDPIAKVIGQPDLAHSMLGFEGKQRYRERATSIVMVGERHLHRFHLHYSPGCHSLTY